ncbi:MFS transporter [Bacillus sp. CGMCC 1.16541]|uniref:MFS transporter n=1 Tax=Bacillus sp. CGMCC 1.16541 TaxID=2185143 RepID=UPI000D72CAC6|nr:MFS transporter [Bacillus sp. CGMCC 1.16541]
MELALKNEKVNVKTIFISYYFLIFFGIGGLFPLLSVYLSDVVKLSGAQVGIIMSISPVVMIFAQPLWGIVSDYTQKPRFVLMSTLLCTGVVGFFFSFVNDYYVFVILAAILAFFQSSLIPISDSIALNYVQKVNGDYGSIRLWGAIGFAVSVLAVGRLSEVFGLHVIFYVFAVVLVAASVLARYLPKESQTMNVRLRDGVSSLLKMPKFVLFLLITFLVFGPIFANNFYFSLYITDIGGTLTGVGIAFLLAAGSEAPFMKVANGWIRRFGMLHILILSAFISGLRWLFYFIEPPLAIVYATTIAQGFSVGLFIPAALQYVRDLAPANVRVTAVSIYAAVGNGLGSWFCTFFGGLVLEKYSIATVYGCFGVLTMFGCLFIFFLRRMEQEKESGI